MVNSNEKNINTLNSVVNNVVAVEDITKKDIFGNADVEMLPSQSLTEKIRRASGEPPVNINPDIKKFLYEDPFK